MDYLHPISGFAVGLVVGMTGVGGGSLMAPLMILLLGVAPTTAVGTDLWFAAISKTVGGAIHHRHGNPDWTVIKRLSLGSLTAAVITLFALSATHGHQLKGGTIIRALGVLLILTAGATLLRRPIHTAAKRVRLETATAFKRWQAALTVFAGAILGVLVTLTSVGAGALGATMLIALYPLRMNARRLVGTDIIHAVPLTLVAGLGHLWMGNVNLVLLGSLLLGSIPGIALGSVIGTRVHARVLRPLLAAVLAFTGYRLLIA